MKSLFILISLMGFNIFACDLQGDFINEYIKSDPYFIQVKVEEYTEYQWHFSGAKIDHLSIDDECKFLEVKYSRIISRKNVNKDHSPWENSRVATTHIVLENVYKTNVDNQLITKKVLEKHNETFLKDAPQIIKDAISSDEYEIDEIVGDSFIRSYNKK